MREWTCPVCGVEFRISLKHTPEEQDDIIKRHRHTKFRGVRTTYTFYAPQRPKEGKA